MDVVYFFKFKVINALDWKTNKSKIITYLLLFGGTFLNAFVSANVIERGNIKFSITQIKAVFLIFLFLVTTMRVFIPNYLPLQEIIPKYFPTSNIKRFIFNLTNNLFTSYFLFAFFFLAVFNTILEQDFLDIEFMTRYIIIVISATATRRLIQLLIERKVVGNKVLLKPLIGIICFFFCYILLFAEILMIHLLTLMLLLIFLFYLESEIFDTTTSTEKYILLIKNTTFAILYGNKMARTTLLMSVIFKTLLLSIITYQYHLKSRYPPHFIVFLFVLPGLPFTYFFNNIWGILKSVWGIIDVATSDGVILRKQLYTFLSIPLLCDFLITITFLCVNPVFFIDGLLSYFVCVVLFTVLCFYWSISFIIPLPDKWSITMSNTTSIIATLCSVLIAGILSLTYINVYFKIIHCFVLLASYFLFTHSSQFYTDRRKNIFKKITKN